MTGRVAWIILFGSAYLIIGWIALVLAGTTPQSFIGFSRAHSGTLTTASWSKPVVTDMYIRVWSADLQSSHRIPIESNSWAHSISLDGSTVVLPTIDKKLAFYDVASRKVIDETSWPDPRSSWGGMFWILSILQTSDLLVFPTHERGGVWRPSQRRYRDYLDKRSPHITLDWNRRYGVIGSIDLETSERVQSLFRFHDDGTAEELREIPFHEDFYFWLAVDSNGTVAVQNDEQLTLTDLQDDQRQITLDNKTGGIQHFSPDNKRLLFSSKEAGNLTIVDLEKNETVATLPLSDRWSLDDLAFQDDDHVVFTKRALLDGRFYDGISDQMTRWNWRTGQTQTVSAGWLEEAETTVWLRWAWGAFAVWFVALAIDGLRHRNRWRPWIDIVSASLFILVVTTTRIWNGNGEVSAPLFLAACLVLLGLLAFWIALGKGTPLMKAAVALMAIAGGTHWLRATIEKLDSYLILDSYTISAILAVVMIVLTIGFLIPRWRGFRIHLPSQPMKEPGDKRGIRFSIRDVLLLTAAIAGLLMAWRGDGFSYRFFVYSMSLDLILPPVGCSVVVLAVAWLALGSRKRPAKYVLAALTILPAVYVFPSFASALVGFGLTTGLLFRAHGYEIRRMAAEN